MLRYKILKTNNDEEIILSLNASDIDQRNINDDGLYDNIINLPENLEKESYKPKNIYKLNFKFYKNGYASDFTNAGFNLPSELKKNIFKKSLFLIEFYDNLISKNRLFSTTLSVYPNTKSGKGPISTVVNDVRNVSSIYEITNSSNEMYFIYNHRVFNNFTDIKNNNGLRYSSMYVKIIFLNGKTGDKQYFVADQNTNNVLSSNYFNDNLYYYEIRFYEDYTYSFYLNDVAQTNIYFKELVVV